MSLKQRSMPFRVKSIAEDGHFSGYGSVFDVVDSYDEFIIKGAFAESLKSHAAAGTYPKLLWQHDSREPIGLWKSMMEDDHGLRVEGQILVSAGPTERRAYEHLKAGSVDGLSIGFSLPPGAMEYDEARKAYRIKQVELWETSVVTFPANASARVESVKHALENPREMERLLRDAGLSRSEAKALIAGGFKAIAQRDAAEAGEAEVEAFRNLTKFIRELSNG